MSNSETSDESEHRRGSATVSHAPKGFPLRSTVRTGWNIFDPDVPFPVALMFESAIEHNSSTLRDYCDRQQVSYAPHGKTTMAPALFRRQSRDKAWAITAATTWQARTMRDAGVPRVLLANEVVVPAEIEWLGTSLVEGFQVCCYVDSLDGVEIIDRTLARVAGDPVLAVLLERGVVGGRTGVRSLAGGDHSRRCRGRIAHGSDSVASEASRGSSVRSATAPPRSSSTSSSTRSWRSPRRSTPRAGSRRPMRSSLTAGGSVYFDRVVDRFRRADLGRPRPNRDARAATSATTMERHRRASPMGRTSRTDHDEHLTPALEVWGAVLSRPEPTRAIVGVGKRDVSTDGLLPVVKKVGRRGATVNESVTPVSRRPGRTTSTRTSTSTRSGPLAVGDFVGFGISHPCTTFDKWRVIWVVDDDYCVVDDRRHVF